MPTPSSTRERVRGAGGAAWRVAGGGRKLRGVLPRFPWPRITALEAEHSRLFLFLVCGVAPAHLCASFLSVDSG